MLNRIKLYVISLWLLFVLIILKEFRWDKWNLESELIENCINLITNNLLSTLSFFLLFLGTCFLINLRRKIKGTLNLPKKIKKLKNLNYEHLTFLTTYIIPFICFELGDVRNVIIFLFLLIIIGAIYVKTNLFYANPTLALLGYQIYEVETEATDSMILIAQGELNEKESFVNLEVGNMVYYAKKITNPKKDE